MTAFTVTDKTDEGFTLEWTSSHTGADGMSFSVSCSPDTAGCSQTVNDPSVMLTGLESATSYTITVNVHLNSEISEDAEEIVVTSK